MKVAIFQFSLFGINTYVVIDPSTKCCAIVDPGMMREEEEEAMTNFIERNGLKPTHVINTHLHIDHVAGNAFLTGKYNIPVMASQKDEPLGWNVKQQAARFGLRKNFEDVSITEYLKDGDKIHIGEGVLEVIEVPGHSQGSIALYDRKDGFVIVGDALFQGSIGRTDLPGGDHSQLIRSIRQRLLTLPDSTVVHNGHGPATTIGEEKASNPFLI